MNNIRVLLVDDHPVVRAGLRAMLGDLEGITVVAEAADGGAALAELARLHTLGEPVDVVLMDLQMGAGHGRRHAPPAGSRQERPASPPPPVLILTTYDTDADILAAVEAGASGYMLKDAPPEQIRQAVLSAAAGGTALAPEVAARLMGRIRNPEPALSAREVQLLDCWPPGWETGRSRSSCSFPRPRSRRTWCTSTASSAWTTAPPRSPWQRSAGSSGGPRRSRHPK